MALRRNSDSFWILRHASSRPLSPSRLRQEPPLLSCPQHRCAGSMAPFITSVPFTVCKAAAAEKESKHFAESSASLLSQWGTYLPPCRGAAPAHAPCCHGRTRTPPRRPVSKQHQIAPGHVTEGGCLTTIGKRTCKLPSCLCTASRDLKCFIITVSFRLMLIPKITFHL